jgi:hypothetical protein
MERMERFGGLKQTARLAAVLTAPAFILQPVSERVEGQPIRPQKGLNFRARSCPIPIVFKIGHSEPESDSFASRRVASLI